VSHVERRACVRFNVPDASVSWVHPRRLPFGSATTETGCRLMDLSRGGARFLSSGSLKPGARLELEIAVPDGERPMLLSGRVSWSWLHPSHSYEVGVEFDPYGDVPGANAPEVLDRIVVLEALLAPRPAGTGDCPVGDSPAGFVPTVPEQGFEQPMSAGV